MSHDDPNTPKWPPTEDRTGSTGAETTRRFVARGILAHLAAEPGSDTRQTEGHEVVSWSDFVDLYRRKRKESPPVLRRGLESVREKITPLEISTREWFMEEISLRPPKDVNVRPIEIVTPGLDLSGAPLAKANLRKIRFNAADLSGADLAGADLSWSDLSGANLEKASLANAVAKAADFRGTRLSGANLHETNLRGARLGGADLRKADLSGADLSGANLRDADCSGANLYATKVSRFTDARGASIHGASFAPVLVDKNGVSLPATTVEIMLARGFVPDAPIGPDLREENARLRRELAEVRAIAEEALRRAERRTPEEFS